MQIIFTLSGMIKNLRDNPALDAGAVSTACFLLHFQRQSQEPTGVPRGVKHWFLACNTTPGWLFIFSPVNKWEEKAEKLCNIW